MLDLFIMTSSRRDSWEVMNANEDFLQRFTWYIVYCFHVKYLKHININHVLFSTGDATRWNHVVVILIELRYRPNQGAAASKAFCKVFLLVSDRNSDMMTSLYVVDDFQHKSIKFDPTLDRRAASLLQIRQGSFSVLLYLDKQHNLLSFQWVVYVYSL